MSRKFNEIKSSPNSQIQYAISTAIAEKTLLSIKNTISRGETILPWRTESPMGYKGAPELQTPRKHEKITLNWVLHVMTKDRCLNRVQ